MKIIILFFLFVLVYSQLSAQFNGGFGDGATKSYTTAKLNGDQVGVYNGGSRDGAYRALQVSISMQEGCDYNIVVAGATGTQIFQAENNISASGIINATNILFRTGNEVNLLTSFEVSMNGGIFEIEQVSCPD